MMLPVTCGMLLIEVTGKRQLLYLLPSSFLSDRDVPFVIFLSAVRCEVRLFLLVFLRCEVRLFQISLRSAAQSAKCENRGENADNSAKVRKCGVRKCGAQKKCGKFCESAKSAECEK